MDTIFISDLHLDETNPDMADLFLDFLRNATTSAKALYILGDFFETWIGDDDITPFTQKIIDGLNAATQAGLVIYFMHGNRDFLIGKKFLQATGCYLLTDECVMAINAVPTLLMHGDTLCTADHAYLRFRKKARNWFLQKIFLLKSLKTRRAIAERYRKASKAHTSTVADYILDVTPAEVERVMLKHQVQHLIHGHTHRPAVHHFELNAKPATRTVLGPWHEEGSALLCHGDGRQEIVTVTVRS